MSTCKWSMQFLSLTLQNRTYVLRVLELSCITIDALLRCHRNFHLFILDYIVLPSCSGSGHLGERPKVIGRVQYRSFHAFVNGHDECQRYEQLHVCPPMIRFIVGVAHIFYQLNFKGVIASAEEFLGIFHITSSVPSFLWSFTRKPVCCDLQANLS
jgi:hypothetical protein